MSSHKLLNLLSVKKKREVKQGEEKVFNLDGIKLTTFASDGPRGSRDKLVNQCFLNFTESLIKFCVPSHVNIYPFA